MTTFVVFTDSYRRGRTVTKRHEIQAVDILAARDLALKAHTLPSAVPVTVSMVWPKWTR